MARKISSNVYIYTECLKKCPILFLSEKYEALSMNSDTAQTTTMCGEIHFVPKFKMAVHHFISCILKSLMTLECGVMQDYAKWGTFLNTL